ncbi:hypothetical protein HMPREF9318_02051 [Streptococcus urinalis FB127-CNA-2]|uniref:UPF0298 protein STRUR_1725 n=1 Tax=Streptococcus urinalis 2285-97 TaxID=764291 RepID=G5KCI6_9STRE|nr:DUF2129 domain-containing protein [Streptococcus urinalis]EHJ56631.1 hypothetical protein STRUR_1725 [Streptococcus urinalis 2285-97]EKS17174.1 hypothetical protein HMPREF9318_02051 [Streptococcus urinalis FB127-CNA-2]VEF32576.1 hypothetical cytosolic protein [Streptococcus urinalis]
MFEKTKRVGLIVYLYYNRDARKLQKYGDFHYHSRKMRYILLYLNEDHLQETADEIAKLKFVKAVKPSYFEDIDQDFVGILTR